MPPLHPLAHLPDYQTSPALHAAPHAPQFAPSVPVVTHAVPHWVVPPPQLVAHLPDEQTSPALHTLPQAPQLVTSWASEVQAAPHTCAPSPQLSPASGLGPVTARLSLEHARMVAVEAKTSANKTDGNFDKAGNIIG